MYLRVSITEDIEPTLRAYLQPGRRFASVEFQLLSTQRSALRAHTDASLGMHLCFARVDGAGTLPNYTKSSRTVWYIGHFTPAYNLNRDFLPRVQRFALHARPSGLTPDVLCNMVELHFLPRGLSPHEIRLSASHAALRAARSAIGFNSDVFCKMNSTFCLACSASRCTLGHRV
ncbi:hypothetical protein C8R47DRAFT_1082389 [Mycena vitilis]|nr:hypothetical protein C8R47DRAFT_1082389 [Mycena vitilis]